MERGERNGRGGKKQEKARQRPSGREHNSYF